MNVDRLRSLAPDVRWHGLSETSSTNDVARELAHQGAPHGTAVVADHQTAGRGRLGRSWRAPAGANVLLSVLLRSHLQAERIGLVSLAAGLSVAEACGPDWRVKWPNDVVAPDDRKLAGILAEAEWADREPRFLVVGIGINVHARPIDLPAVALAETGEAPEREALAARVVVGLLGWVARSPAFIRDAWRARSATLGRDVEISGIRGLAVDIDEQGALLVQNEDGLHSVRAGDLELRGP